MVEREEKAKVSTKAKSLDKWKRKKWFTILAPEAFKKREIGETPAQKDAQLIGRTIVLTLDKLTGQRTQRHIDVKFKITGVKGLNADTEITGHEIKQSYLDRIIRRRRSKIVSVISRKTKDENRMQVNSLTLTARKVERRKEKAVRRVMDEEIAKTIERSTADRLMEEILFGALASRIFKQAKDITQLKRIEITKSEIERKANAANTTA